MSEAVPSECIRAAIDGPLSEDEVEALAAGYAVLRRGVHALPEAVLRAVEPPLRSTPAPSAEP
ncbi:MAG: hypothetical protein M3336_15180 [Chloroflexota bacterium]|nr:hypothetical protein [Chloroflexota bacterium]